MTKIVDIYTCPRCHGEHKSALLYPLSAVNDKYTHWGTCPVTEEPYLLRDLSVNEPLGEALDALKRIWGWTDNDDYCSSPDSSVFSGCEDPTCVWCQDNQNAQRVLKKYGCY